MNKKKPGHKPKSKVGSISGKDARNQAVEAARIAKQNNKGKIKVRINRTTWCTVVEILILPDQFEEIKKKYGIEE